MVTYAKSTPLNPAAHSFIDWSYPSAFDKKLAATFITPHIGVKINVQKVKLRVPVLVSMTDPTL